MKTLSLLGALVVSLLAAHTHAALVTLVSTGSVWRYLDDGSNQGTAWRLPAFDDAAWKAGAAELGYGDATEGRPEATVIGYGPNANSKFITSYFRRAFTVAGAPAFTNLTLRVMRDDGAVVYLNGTEVFRSNMPAGAVTYTTLASAAIGGADESAFVVANVSPSLLVDGANVLAVEIHQSAVNSSDVSFDLELTGTQVEQTIALNTPSNGAADLVTSPTLDAIVSDASGDNLTVTFYGRPAPAAPGNDFTIVAIPDTQFYSSSLNGGLPAMFYSQVDWILTNRIARNIVFATQLGDCVQNGDQFLAEWIVATNALYRLEDPFLSLLAEGLPYGLVVGNHDQSPAGSAAGATTYFNQFFGESHFLGRSYYGGHFGTNNDNNYELFSASGMDFIAIHFEYNTTGDYNPVLSWANNLLQTHSNRRAILATHHLINAGNPGSFSAFGQAIYSALKTNANLFLMLGGHVTEEGQRQDTFNSRTVYSLLSDYQARTGGGNGWLRIMEFSPSNNVIRVKTFSPWLNQFETDANSQFNLSYNMQPAGAAFSVIATRTGVPSGANATAVWSSLAANSTYEWYIVASDGVSSTTSPTWRFTTGDGAPRAPSVSITAPANNAAFGAPADIVISAAASDADGSVTNVEFYAGTAKLGDDATAPFSFTWTTVSEGAYALTAVAFDDSGMSATSAVIDITVTSGPVPNTLPLAALTLPANDATFTAPANVTVTANASDSDGTISKVEFFQGTTKIGQSLAPPYSMTWGQVSAGSYTLRAVASDNAGGQGTSGPVNITVLTPNETAVITRGPYLQLGTPTGMVVRWRTDLPTETRLRYGTNSGSLDSLFTDPANVTEHVAALTGLQADTKYFYEMGTALGWYAPDVNDFFVTAPAVGTPKPTRVWLLGDSGTANANAANVRNAYLNYTSVRGTDLLLMLGDNAYNSGTDAEYGTAVFNFYPTVLQNTVLWPTIGNHDTAQSPTPPASLAYFNIFTLPQNGEAGGVPSGTEKYYSFDYANVHFICLDSMSSVRTVNSAMMNWLEADVAATTQPWLIAFWHHPPYSKGSHNSDIEIELIQMRTNALPILEAAGVDLVFCGHSHSYERTVLLDGHYGLSTTLLQNMKRNAGSGRTDSGDGAYQKPAGLSAGQGSVYTAAGASGQISGGALNHPAMFMSANALGSVVLDINSNRVDAVYLGTNGAAVDHYTIIKADPPPPLPAAPSGLLVVALSSSEIELSWTDNVVNEQGFALERSLDGINFAPLAIVGANVTNGVEVGLSAATTYYYRVYAFNDSGASAFSSIASATTSGPMLPPAATGLTAAAGDSFVVLLWDFTPNTTNYNVHRSGQPGGPYVQIASAVESPSFTDNSAVNGQAYYYVVSAVGEAGEGPFSNEASATPNRPAPAAPSGVMALSGDGFVALSWNISGGADSSFVKRADVSGGPYAAVATNVTATNYNDVAVVNGATYYYVVSAVNTGGESSNSVEVLGSPLATPAVPNNFQATGGDNIVLLSWDLAANATAYRLKRAIEDGPFQQLAIVTTTSYSDTSVSNGTSYRYVLSALNGAVESAETSAIGTAPIAPPPAVPTGLTAARGDAQITLHWNSSSGAVTYSVKRALVSGGPYSLVGSGLTATNFTDIGLVNGTPYFYVASASNSSGESPDSSEASATPLAPPAAPSGLNATAMSTSQIELSWIDNSLFETSFEVEKSTDGTSFVLVSTLMADSTTLSVTGLSTATTYYYRVRAVNAGGPSAYSATVSATTFDVPPSAPVNFSATTVSASQISLTWTDAANNEIGFSVEQSTDAMNFSLVATLGANVTSGTVYSLTANTTYYFRVRAFNAYGNSSNATASATTLPLLPAAPTGVSAVATNNKVTLTWNFVSGATSYRVKRSLSSGGPFSNIATVTTNIYGNTGLNNGTQYFYVIAAVGAVGTGPDSAVVSATPQAPPSAPTSLSISSVSQTQLNLTWNDRSGNELGFRIERALASSGPFTEIATVGANVRSFANTGLQRNTRYYYRVRAYHAAGNSAYSGTANGRTKS